MLTKGSQKEKPRHRGLSCSSGDRDPAALEKERRNYICPVEINNRGKRLYTFDSLARRPAVIGAAIKKNIQ